MLEGQLGCKLFKRGARGIELTEEGLELKIHAVNVETQINIGHKRLRGRDTDIEGPLRLSMIDALANGLLEDLAAFQDVYPKIDLQIDIDYDLTDLASVETDMVMRFSKNPPQDLVGRKLASCTTALYSSRTFCDRHALDTDEPTGGHWIGYRLASGPPKWVRESRFADLPFRTEMKSIWLQFQACRTGMGIAELPCFLAEPETGLTRLTAPLHRKRYQLWLLKHPDLRSNKRTPSFFRVYWRQAAEEETPV